MRKRIVAANIKLSAHTSRKVRMTAHANRSLVASRVTKASAAIDLWAKEHCADPVKDKLKRFELFAHFSEQSFFPTIDAAAARYLEA